jgi:hypothetical protein
MSDSSLARIIQSFGNGFLLRLYSVWSEPLMEVSGCRCEPSLQIRPIFTVVHVKSNVTVSLHDPLIKVYHQCLQEQPIDMTTHSLRKLYNLLCIYLLTYVCIYVRFKNVCN